MSINKRNHSLSKVFAGCLLVLRKVQGQALEPTQNVTEVLSVVTIGGNLITETFTPTSLSVSGLVPPITSETTITSTNSAGETVAIAVAAGAGVVAGGAVAAWLFKPVPGAPPAPTEPPPYPTETQDTAPETSSPDPTTMSTSTSEAPACPFPSTGYPISFQGAPEQPQWTLAIPSLSTSALTPRCTQQGDNKQLLRGTDPGYMNALAQVFCKGDLSKDESATLGQSDLPSDSNWKSAQLNGIRVKFDFKYKLSDPGCAQNCVDAYTQMATACQYDSHSLYGSGSLEQGCGTYDMAVDADPDTKLECNNAPADNIYHQYEYRDGAVESINEFCTAQDGKLLKQGGGSDIKESAFSATYAAGCEGSGTYKIDKDLCVQYLMQTVDNCETQTVTYKHGGTITDIDNCGSFSFHPFGYDIFACYPQNEDAGYISGNHVAISSEMAQDAIGRFCDRSGGDEKYTLDPNNTPASTEFSDDTCTKDGYAACTYYYNADGSAADGTEGSDISVRLRARFVNLGDQGICSANQTYEIHGDRCHKQLEKVIGVEPQGMCAGSDPKQLGLGSFFESGDKGCVLWDFFATSTT